MVLKPVLSALVVPIIKQLTVRGIRSSAPLNMDIVLEEVEKLEPESAVNGWTLLALPFVGLPSIYIGFKIATYFQAEEIVAVYSGIGLAVVMIFALVIWSFCREAIKQAQKRANSSRLA